MKVSLRLVLKCLSVAGNTPPGSSLLSGDNYNLTSEIMASDRVWVSPLGPPEQVRKGGDRDQLLDEGK